MLAVLMFLSAGGVVASTTWDTQIDVGGGYTAKCPLLGGGTVETEQGVLDERHPRCPGSRGNRIVVAGALLMGSTLLVGVALWRFQRANPS